MRFGITVAAKVLHKHYSHTLIIRENVRVVRCSKKSHVAKKKKEKIEVMSLRFGVFFLHQTRWDFYILKAFFFFAAICTYCLFLYGTD